jgi:hypothetical protein
MAFSSFHHCHSDLEQQARQHGVSRGHPNQRIEIVEENSFQTFELKSEEPLQG